MNQPDVHLPVGRGDDRPGRLIRGNPILVKEIRALFRQKRSWSILTFCLVAVGGITLLLYVSMLATNAVAPDPDIRRKLGRAIFYAITLFQFIAISLVAPPFTADTITSEQEENTLDLLRTTAVSAGSIIRGKLLAGEVYTGHLPACAKQRVLDRWPGSLRIPCEYRPVVYHDVLLMLSGYLGFRSQ